MPAKPRPSAATGSRTTTTATNATGATKPRPPEPAVKGPVAPSDAPAASITERGFDGWPTPPTPDYLIPKMGELPVSSTVHFRTVVMNRLDAFSWPDVWRRLKPFLVPALQERVSTAEIEVAGVAPDADALISDLAPMRERLAEHPQIVRLVHSAFETLVRIRGTIEKAPQRDVVEQLAGALMRVVEVVRREPGAADLGDLQDVARRAAALHARLRAALDAPAAPAVSDPSAIERRLLHPEPATLEELADRISATGLTAFDVFNDRLPIDGDPRQLTMTEALYGLCGIANDSLVDPLHAGERLDLPNLPAEGVILYQEQGWFARGLSLGNLLHSVALAPGEVTQIAMTHWNHSTRATDSETETQVDTAAESDLQDRAVSEIQHAATAEHASGGSTAASFSATEQASVSGLFVSAAAASSQSVSTAVSYNDAGKDMLMTANQAVNATTQRHAEAARTRRASVVREVSQSEDETLTTRVLANYNHMHALTVMYFEVVEVFDLKTRVVDAERVVFLPFKVREVTELIPRYRAILIDAAMRAGKPALAEAMRHYRESEGAAAERGKQLEERLARLAQADAADQARIDKIDGELAGLVAETAADRKVLADGLAAENVRLATLQDETAQRHALAAGPMAAFFGIQLRQAFEHERAGIAAAVQAARQRLEQFDAALRTRRGALQNEKDRLTAAVRARAGERELIEATQSLLRPRSDPSAPGPFDDHRLYFNQAVWLSLSPGDVLALARRYHRGQLLSTQIDPAPVAITGTYVGYKWRIADPVAAVAFKRQFVEPFVGDPKRELATAQATIAVPTGGVFGEAVLGQAVSAEKIDLSRFWHWKDSMIPILPPRMKPLQAATPGVQDLNARPTGLDPTSAKLGALQDLPAPSGFNALAEAMRSQMFRDLSGQDLVKAIGEATAKHAADAAANAAKTGSENLRSGLDFVKQMAPIAMSALAAPETGGMSLIGGIMNAKGAGGESDMLAKAADFVVGNALKGGTPGTGGGGGDAAASTDTDGQTPPESELEPVNPKP